MLILDHWYEMVFLLGIVGMMIVTLVLFGGLMYAILKKEETHMSEHATDAPYKDKWMILADSIIGMDHTKKNPPIPCQDSHTIIKINDQWGIAVVSDGLGSKPLSHLGSAFVSQKTADYLKQVVQEKEWVEQENLPESAEWNAIAYETLYRVHKALKGYAKINGYNINDLACTVIAVVYSPIGLLVTHIGDGRAGYCTKDGQWRSMIIPINGESSSEVMPITAPFWEESRSIGMFVESNVVDTPVEAFTLMSDGCESFSYETLKWNQKNGRYDEINLPYKDFFDPVIAYFSQKRSVHTEEEIAEEWHDFLSHGTEKIKYEPDDKTMILGFIPNKEQYHDNENR